MKGREGGDVQLGRADPVVELERPRERLEPRDRVRRQPSEAHLVEHVDEFYKPSINHQLQLNGNEKGGKVKIIERTDEDPADETPA